MKIKYKLYFVFSILVLIECGFIINTYLSKKKDNIEVNIASCSTLKLSQKQQCWENLIETTLDTKGLTGTFELFDTLFSTDKDFATDCHAYAHTLGKKAYALFAEHKKVTLSNKTSYCAYGFYHGFMESLIHKSGNLAEARKFCDDADRQLKKDTNDAGGACYHGIGHGFVADTPDPSRWGHPQEIIQPGLDVCEKISNDNQTLFRCTTGVFNALEILIDEKKYMLSPNVKDPLSLCRSQKEKYKKSCYTQMASSLLKITNNNFKKAIPFINAIKEDQYAIPTFNAINVERVRLGLTDHDTTIVFCRSLPVRLQIPCVTSFAEGFMKYGPPEKEYIKSLEFCSSQILTEVEKKACFSYITNILRVWYSKEKATKICNTIDKKYRQNSCQYI